MAASGLVAFADATVGRRGRAPGGQPPGGGRPWTVGLQVHNATGAEVALRIWRLNPAAGSGWQDGGPVRLRPGDESRAFFGADQIGLQVGRRWMLVWSPPEAEIPVVAIGEGSWTRIGPHAEPDLEQPLVVGQGVEAEGIAVERLPDADYRPFRVVLR